MYRSSLSFCRELIDICRWASSGTCSLIMHFNICAVVLSSMFELCLNALWHLVNQTSTKLPDPCFSSAFANQRDLPVVLRLRCGFALQYLTGFALVGRSRPQFAAALVEFAATLVDVARKYVPRPHEVLVLRVISRSYLRVSPFLTK